jgi:hypothetical protein
VSNSFSMLYQSGFFGTYFDCIWPAKSLQELFTSAQVIPDPEYKPFDLKSLRTRDPNSDQRLADTNGRSR